MSELDEHRDFLASLSELELNQPHPELRSGNVPEIDAGAAHLAAALTELRISVQRLHADLAQRMRQLEAQASATESKIDARTPEWRALSAEILKASERGGVSAAEKASAVSRELSARLRQVADARDADTKLLRDLIYWVAAPIFVFALILVSTAGASTGGLPQVVLIASGVMLGLGAAHVVPDVRAWFDRMRPR